MTLKNRPQTSLPIDEHPLDFARVETLVQKRPGWCISIYSPTHRAGQDVRQDPIRLKNRLSAAQSQLEQAGVGEEDVQALLGAARKLTDDDSEANRQFWQNQHSCLALFLSAEGAEMYRLPIECDELTVVARRFHVKPLLQALQQAGEYCVLAVSRNLARFFEGDRTGLSETAVEGLPDSLQAVVRGDDEKAFNLHSITSRPTTAGQTAVPHGHGETDDSHDRKLYFKEIAQSVSDRLADGNRPLVFAGVQDLFADLKDAISYPHLVEQPVAGNPDNLAASELHEKAWPLAEAHWHRRNARELERFQEVAHTDLGDDSLEDILLAAGDGRVETLLVNADSRCWGTVDQEARRVSVTEEPGADSYDLVDVGVVRTLRAGGKVVTFTDPKALEGPVAAIYRYPLA